MKTPMQELIENLTEQLDKVVKEHQTEVDKDTYWRGVKIGLETTITLTESMLEKEKEQMCDFVEYCQTEHSKYQETEASWIKELTIDDLFEKRYTK